MSKKHITAPLSYDPGKGRPKEYLAYLNWQEMQALQKLNGGNMERGPRGLPSFPPDDAIGSSQNAGTGNWTGSPGGTTTSGTSSNYPGSGTSTNWGGSNNYGTDPSSWSGSGSNYGGPSSPASSAASSATSAASSAASSAAANAAASTPSSDTAAQQSAAVNDAVKAANNAALRQDIARGGIGSINVGPMQTPVSIGSGAISAAVQAGIQQSYTPSSAALGAITRGPGSVSGMIPGNNDPLAQRQSLYGITNSFNETFGTSYSPTDVSRMARAISGEAIGETAFGRAAVANTMLNRVSLALSDPEKYGYMGGTSPNRILSQYDATGMRVGTTPNAVYSASKPGTTSFQAGLTALNDAMYSGSQFSKTASPRVLSATHYYNPDTANPRWGTRSGREFETVGSHVFGNAEPTEGAVTEARSLSRTANDTAAINLAEVENSYNPGVVADPAAMMTVGALTRLPSVLGDIRLPAIPEASQAQKTAIAAARMMMPESAFQGMVNKAVADAVQNSGFSLSGAISSGISALNQYAPSATAVASKPYQERLMTVDGVTREVSPQQVAGLSSEDQRRLDDELQRQVYTPAGEDQIATVEEEYRDPFAKPGTTTQNYKLFDEAQVYPRYVTPERQALIADQERKNRIGIKIIERAPFVGPVTGAVEGITKLFTGEDIADQATQKKYAFEQMSPEQQTAAMAKDPSLRRYAVSAGIIPPSSGGQYAYSGGTPTRELGGKDSPTMLYLYGRPNYSDRYTSYQAEADDDKSALRKQYRLWDMGIGIPEPGDSDYNDYMKYLKSRGTSAQV